MRSPRQSAKSRGVVLARSVKTLIRHPIDERVQHCHDSGASARGEEAGGREGDEMRIRILRTFGLALLLTGLACTSSVSGQEPKAPAPESLDWLRGRAENQVYSSSLCSTHGTDNKKGPDQVTQPDSATKRRGLASWLLYSSPSLFQAKAPSDNLNGRAHFRTKLGKIIGRFSKIGEDNDWTSP